MNLSYTSKEKFFFFLISLYCFFVCFGNFFRLGVNESAPGFTSIIFFIVLVAFPFRGIRGILSSSILISFLFLLLISLFSAVFYPGKIFIPMMNTGQLFCYLFMAGIAAHISVDTTALKKIYFGLVFGLLLSSLITIVDYLKIYDFPFVNDTKIVSKYGGAEAERAGGFFNRRSAMAANLSLFIPMVTIAALEIKKGSGKIIMLVAAGAAFICLFLTHNRSGILAIILVLTIFTAFNKEYGKIKKIKLGFISSLIALLIGMVLYFYFPEHIEVYKVKIGISDGGRMVGNGSRLAESDGARWFFFVEALKSTLSSPIGHGFAVMYTKRYDYLDPHNIISYIVWATGWCGIAWVIYLFYSFKKILKSILLKKQFNPYVNGIKYGLMSWLLNNMAHNNMHMGIIWILLGIFISVSRNKPIIADEAIKIRV